MQPIVFPESAEMVINDFTDAGHDDLIVGALGDDNNGTDSGSARVLQVKVAWPEGNRNSAEVSTSTPTAGSISTAASTTSRSCSAGPP